MNGWLELRVIVPEDDVAGETPLAEYLGAPERPKHPSVYLYGKAPVFDAAWVCRLDEHRLMGLSVHMVCMN